MKKRLQAKFNRRFPPVMLGIRGIVEGGVFQSTVDWLREFTPAYHVVLNGEELITVRRARLARQSVCRP